MDQNQVEWTLVDRSKWIKTTAELVKQMDQKVYSSESNSDEL